jgi:GNAT superfamily N-acetyltransferase
VGVTYVYDHDGRIVAYMTVTAWTLEPDILVALEGRGFPPYPLPVLKIARLATAEGEQRRGYGSALLSYAFAMALKMSSEMGCVGISTDAKPGAMDYYAARGFVFIDTVGDLGAPRGTEREMFLSLRTIEAALQE